MLTTKIGLSKRLQMPRDSLKWLLASFYSRTNQIHVTVTIVSVVLANVCHSRDNGRLTDRDAEQLAGVLRSFEAVYRLGKRKRGGRCGGLFPDLEWRYGGNVSIVFRKIS